MKVQYASRVYNVYQSSKNWLTASMILHCFQNVFHETWFSVSEKGRSQRRKVGRIWGMGTNFKAAVSCSSHRNLGCVSWRIAVQEQNALSQFCPSFYACFIRSYDQVDKIRFILVKRQKISGNVTIGKGCRQSDPLSCYIFTLCVENLSLKTRNSNKIKGIKINILEHKYLNLRTIQH
jgi:hypothetical protein